MPSDVESRDAARDKHYVMFYGKWRRVPYFVQRLAARVFPRLFGGCATSTIYADGKLVGQLIADEADRG